MKKPLAVLSLSLTILLLGCQKDIKNKEAVRQGVMEYLSKRTDLGPMNVQVEAVSFKDKEAEALVSFQPKGGAVNGGGMQMRYNLERQSNKWVVKGRSAGSGTENPHGGSSVAPPLPAPVPQPNLPPGHPDLGKH